VEERGEPGYWINDAFSQKTQSRMVFVCVLKFDSNTTRSGTRSCRHYHEGRNPTAVRISKKDCLTRGGKLIASVGKRAGKGLIRRERNAGETRSVEGRLREGEEVATLFERRKIGGEKKGKSPFSSPHTTSEKPKKHRRGKEEEGPFGGVETPSRRSSRTIFGNGCSVSQRGRFNPQGREKEIEGGKKV